MPSVSLLGRSNIKRLRHEEIPHGQTEEVMFTKKPALPPLSFDEMYALTVFKTPAERDAAARYAKFAEDRGLMMPVPVCYDAAAWGSTCQIEDMQLSKRERIAAMCLQGLLASGNRDSLEPLERADIAVIYADALIKALEGKP
jgi:hypothetical protein